MSLSGTSATTKVSVPSCAQRTTALIDADGLDGVTLRKLAQRLGVQAPTLYWHLPNKAALVTVLAEEILEQEFPAAALVPPGPDQGWQDWLSVLAQRLRRALLAHPDGAQVVSASPPIRPWWPASPPTSSPAAPSTTSSATALS
jgi:AcrR family transcriptional regulator